MKPAQSAGFKSLLMRGDQFHGIPRFLDPANNDQSAMPELINGKCTST